ncbi:filamentous hemagglutinin N-terminal domain-containing protein [Hyella patelloides]|nr:filamentous hemagglutinin N-terminal domain-containing protein [Hyella patelloides]
MSGVVTFCYWFPNLVQAQVVPDSTTPTTKITGDCLVQCDITGGVRADSNLFHSFREFNIGIGESLYFVDPGVANIFSRVTGNNSSEILGNLGVTGNANLWLINPQGIIFGNGATLDVNGSFVATTAEEIAFGDRGFFSANPDSQENLPLLTVNPSAFFYRQMGQNEPITIEGASLAVPDRENIVLLGAQNSESIPGVSLQGATISASQGNIQIGAIAADGIIKIDPDFQLEFSEDIARGDITVAQGSVIESSGMGGGSINIRGGELNVSGNSQIRSRTLGDTDGEDISITANTLNINGGLISSSSSGAGKSSNIIINTEILNVSGYGADSFQNLIRRGVTGNLSVEENEVSGIITLANNTGAAGNINVESDNIVFTDGAFLGNAIYSKGQGGDIDITATQNIELIRSGVLSLSALNSVGNTGNVTINAQKLIVQDGSLISTSTLGQGEGGDITIEAEESIELLRTPASSILPTSIFTNSVSPNSGDDTSPNSGNAGNLNLSTKTLIIQDGSQISSASGLLIGEGEVLPSGGAGGDIKIHADESVTISGSSENGIFPSSILSSTGINSNKPAGNITIDTSRFFFEGQALISASSVGEGNGGDIEINADEFMQINGSNETLPALIAESSSGVGIPNIDLTLVRGALLAITAVGEGGKIKLTTPILNLDKSSLISTISFGSGNGGNIEIEASQKVEVSNDVIISTATLSSGDAGDVNIDTNQLIANNNSIITTFSSGLGKAGDMTINADKINLESGGSLNATTQSGEEGNIDLTIADSLKLGDRASITTNAGNQGSGGNIKIDTGFLIAFPSSSITATANNGQGGNIDIKAQELFVASPNQIDASSDSGIDGRVNIERFNNNLRNNLTKLPDKTLERSNQIVSRCGAGDELAQNSFVYTGKGALPPSPLDGNFYSDEFLVDWGTETSEFELHQVHQSPNTEIVEATGWIVSDRGNVVLTSEKPSQILLPQYWDTCPFGNDK